MNLANDIFYIGILMDRFLLLLFYNLSHLYIVVVILDIHIISVILHGLGILF